MQVTIDTRHDTLEEALAVIQLAFSRAGDHRVSWLRQTPANRHEEDCGQEASGIQAS